MVIKDLEIDIYADGADIDGMLKLYSRGIVKGFTTNPSLMKKAGVQDYKRFVKEITQRITDVPVSFEVFSDDFENMRKEALCLSKCGHNVYVKIPITNSKGESSTPLIKELSEEGVKLNITAVFTLNQVDKVLEALSPKAESIISVFAGRIADTGIDPENIMKEVAVMCHDRQGVKSLWASCREVLNIIQADRCGTDIITVTNDILAKLGNIGKDLNQYSLETVQMFERDGRSLGYSIL